MFASGVPVLPAVARRPLPAVVAETIEEMVASAGLGPGERLPTETELAEQLRVGRSTLREALAELERSGLIERRWGVGTLVAAPPPRHGLEVLESFDALAARQGWVCATADLRLRRARATERQATRLGVEPGTRVTHLTRTKTRDGAPLARITSVVPEHVVGYDLLVERFAGSLTAVLADLPRTPLRHARVEMQPGRVNRVLADQLHLRPGTPLLVLDEELRGADGEVLAWNVLELAPGGVRVEVVRRT